MDNEPKLRVCKYINCRHQSKINIAGEPFHKDQHGYYHADCYREKCDLELFRDIWKKNVSNTVVISYLNKVLNELLACGVSSDFLLFALQHVVKNHLPLRYPNGFRYYVDNQNIKDEYNKSKRVFFKDDCFAVSEELDHAPSFSIRKKDQGFQSVLKR